MRGTGTGTVDHKLTREEHSTTGSTTGYYSITGISGHVSGFYIDDLPFSTSENDTLLPKRFLKSFGGQILGLLVPLFLDFW